MRVEFDPAKNTKNIETRNLPFSRVTDLDWDSSVTYEDIRKTYPERRYITLAFLGNRLHVVCYALRRLPENDIPDCAGLSFVFKAR